MLEYFGLQADPFGTSPDPKCLYPSLTHRKAWASIDEGFKSNRGFTAMIAPPGMGKTTLLFRFLEDVKDSACSVFLFDITADCEPRDFLRYVLNEIGVTPKRSSSEMHEQLSEVLIKETRAGRRFVVVIDEAQNLSDAVLERVRLLSNFETTQGKLIHIVLSGQPQLADTLMKPSLLQLRQRIATICRLAPLSPEETGAYISYRLQQAGYSGEPLFSPQSIEKIAVASQGIPRNINSLCYSSLSLCSTLKGRQVDTSMVAEVFGDLRLTPESSAPIPAVEVPSPKPHRKRTHHKRTFIQRRYWVTAAATFIVLCILGVLSFAGLRNSLLAKADDARSMIQKDSPAPLAASTTTGMVEAVAAESEAPFSGFAIVVEPNETLREISVHYLGYFNPQILHQIQTLNPTLTDPDHLESGQVLWLPGQPSADAKKATSSASASARP